MLSIGFHLYMEMLDKAVSDVKAGKTPELATSLHQGPEIELGISTILPESYMGDIHTRLLFYKRIAGASKEEELDDIQSEMIDRFGLLPPPAKQLFLITELKIVAEVLGITKIHAKNEQGRMEFIPTPSIHPHTLLRLLQLQPQRYQLDGPQRLKFTLDATPHPIDKIRAIRELLQTLSKEA
jgi:transcription-repair coupling factor (superfamily II helicase)